MSGMPVIQGLFCRALQDTDYAAKCLRQLLKSVVRYEWAERVAAFHRVSAWLHFGLHSFAAP